MSIPIKKACWWVAGAVVLIGGIAVAVYGDGWLRSLVEIVSEYISKNLSYISVGVVVGGGILAWHYWARIRESMRDDPLLWVAGAVTVFIAGLAFIFCCHEWIADWLNIELLPPPQVTAEPTKMSRFEFISCLVVGWVVVFAIVIAVLSDREWQERVTKHVKKFINDRPFLKGFLFFVGAFVLPVLATGLATWSINVIEWLFNLFGSNVEEWLSGGDGNDGSDGDNVGGSKYRVDILIGLGSVLGIMALAWRSYASQIQAKASLMQAELSARLAKSTVRQAEAMAKQAERQSELSAKQAEESRKKQVSDQFIQAMEQLARVDNRSKPLKEARVGGLNSLESLAHADLEGYGVQVMKTIVAYIRENAQKTAGKILEKNGNADTDEQRTRPLGEDVKVAFDVLKRLYDSYANAPEKRKDIGLVRFFDDGEPSARETFEPKKPVRDDLDFSRADFHKLDFRGVDWIDRPCCDRTNFQQANLWNANLAGAHLEEALLQKVYAYDVVLRGANLRDAQLYKAQLKKADLRQAKLESAELDEANLEEAQLNGANLTFACLHAADLVKACLNEAILEGSSLCAVKMWAAELYGTNLKNAWLHGVDLMTARLVGADLSGAQLQGANLCNAWLQGADLENAQLDYGFWEHTSTRVQDGDVRNLESLLEGKVGNYAKVRIVNRFNLKGGNEGLWKPKSAEILCHEEFAPLNYHNNPARLLKPDDDSVDSWQKKWEEIIGNFGRYTPPSPYGKSHRYIIQGFINIHGQRYYPIGSPRGSQNEFPCAHGLRAAVKDLIERLYKVVEEFEVKDWFSEGYIEWIYEGKSSPPKPSGKKS